jgi:hypothetical protein
MRQDLVKCFVVGCSRSGTTLLSVMLDRHSQLAMTPETGFYAEISPHLRENSKAELAALLSRWPRLSELDLTVDNVVDLCDEPISAGAAFSTILRLYADSRGKAFCGEKTPGHWRALDALLTDFPEAHIIFMIRDGRDASLSLASMPWWKRDLQAAAAVWLEAARTLRQFSKTHPDRLTVVHYENLAAEPLPILTSLMTKIGLAFEDRQLDSDRGSGIILQRSMAWKGRALTSVDQSRVGHWRTSATPDQAEFLNKTLETELAYFGYL